MTRTIDQVDADLQATKSAVPTLEEQLFSVVLPCWANNNTPVSQINIRYGATLLVVPFALRVLSVAASWEYWTLAASDTVYWTGTIERDSGGTWSNLAARSTQVTGQYANGGVTPRTAWTWDSAVWADITLSAGDLLAVDWAPTGSPVAMTLPVTYTIRYQAV